MRREISSPATIPELAAFSRQATHLSWAIRKEMWRGGQTFALHVDGELAGIAGIYPLGEGIGEFWLDVAPDAGRHIFAIAKHFKLTAPAAGYREIVVICRSAAGKTIARRCGFSFSEPCEVGEIWTWTPSSAAAPRKPRQGS